jgi:histidine triad (HIT) family protein
LKTNCVFCRIIHGEEKAEKVFEDEDTLVIEDIFPRAPFHYLVLPKKHFDSLLDVDDGALLGKLLITAKKVAEEKGFAPQGFRVVLNCGRGGGQSVFHLHLHVLGGRSLPWLPG